MPRNPSNPGQVAGERHPCAVLTWAIVRRMRRQWATGNRTGLVNHWVSHYGVSQPAISQILTGKTWREPNGNKRRA